ncbi:MAG: hypothetical protein AMXMBFR82_29020 [Candidatus Hydrogenedentota bacterium]
MTFRPLLLAACAAIWAGAVGAQPSADLGHTDSNRYLTFHGEGVVLVGDSGTQCVMQNTNLDYRRWIEDCADAGLSVVHIWSFVVPRQQLDGSDVEDRYGYVYPGITPWARKIDGPRAKDGGFQWDLHAWDEGNDPTHYWPRLRDFCAYAKEKGLVVGITVFWGWPKHPSDWAYHPFNSVNGGPVTEDVRIHVSQVQRIATPGLEVWEETYANDWDTAKKTQWHWERLAKKLIDDTASFGNVFFVFMDEHSYDEGNGGDHFRDFFKKRGALWVDWDKRRESVDVVFADIAYRADSGKNSGTVKLVTRQPLRPFIILEGGPYAGDEVRAAIWTTLVGGGNYVFHNDAEQETVQTGIMGYDPNVPGGDTGQIRREWLGHASRFFNDAVESLDSLMPHNELTGDGTFCLADPGREYVVYSMAGSASIPLTLHGPGAVESLRLYNPRTGEWIESAEHTSAGSTMTVNKPDADDWVLLVHQSVE